MWINLSVSFLSFIIVRPSAHGARVLHYCIAIAACGALGTMLLLVLAVVASTVSQSFGSQTCTAFPEFAMLQRFGIGSEDNILGVAVDPTTGCVAVGGITRCSGPSSHTDAFVGLFDPIGNQLWLQRFGTDRSDVLHGIDINPANGDIAVGGYTVGTFPGAQQHSPGSRSNVDRDVFVALFDSNGTQLWLKQFGTTSSEEIRGVAVDPRTGNMAVSGETYGTFPGQSGGGDANAFVALFDQNGTQLWLNQFGSAAVSIAHGVTISTSTSIVACSGQVYGQFPGQQRAGTFDAFVALFDPNGTLIWLEQFGTGNQDNAFSVAIKSETGAIAVGGYAGTGGGGAFPGHQSAGASDAFVALFSSNGTQLWLNQFGTNDTDWIHDIAIDNATGSIAVIGYTGGTFLGQESAGAHDAFVALFDSNGSRHWLQQFGSDSYDRGRGVAINSVTGSIAVAGRLDSDAFVALTNSCHSSAPTTLPTVQPMTSTLSTSTPTETPSRAPAATPSNSPTTDPTETPTFAPVSTQPSAVPSHALSRHACDDGSHGCDSTEFGICLPLLSPSTGYRCDCADTHRCSDGDCTTVSHTCVLITSNPTGTPTTSIPTSLPTTDPVISPTKIPTQLDTPSGSSSNDDSSDGWIDNVIIVGGAVAVVVLLLALLLLRKRAKNKARRQALEPLDNAVTNPTFSSTGSRGQLDADAYAIPAINAASNPDYASIDYSDVGNMSRGKTSCSSYADLTPDRSKYETTA